MQTSKNSEKSRGIVAFAFNTDAVDYVKIAEQTVALAGQVLGLPYTIITSVPDSGIKNQRYSIDELKFVEWRNPGRYQAYDLSPYDETLVIDVDYVVQNRDLLKIFDVDSWDYMLMRNNINVSGAPCEQHMGPESLPFVWATVFAFRRSAKSQLFFDLVKRVQDHYGYYQALFGIRERNYRNDYAFAIADIILNGYTIGTNSIPGPMLTVDTPIRSIKVKDHAFVIKDAERGYVVPRTNLHIMSKRYLLSDNFNQFISHVTA